MSTRLKDSRFIAMDKVVSALERYEGRSIVLREATLIGNSLQVKLRMFERDHSGVFVTTNGEADSNENN